MYSKNHNIVKTNTVVINDFSEKYFTPVFWATGYVALSLSLSLSLSANIVPSLVLRHQKGKISWKTCVP